MISGPKDCALASRPPVGVTLRMHRTPNIMGEKELTKIGPGFYVDKNRWVYFNVREFLDFHKLTDSPEVRQAIWNQVSSDFGIIGIKELFDEV
jgi:hypothetical protein